ncbi:alpha/beta fold hydrolase [Methanobacterium sp. ACI-7]|uniref:alpha/beta fold hydrolase n=1 Tax=unclassified Methanobacterium TaxID=2627676 RepID=UPI0039C1BEE0
MEPQYYTVNNFKFESEFVLPHLKIEYHAFGKKEVNEEGNLTNGIIYLHGMSGDYTSIKRIKDIIGPGKPIDTEKYYIICPTALGSPGSSAPSTSGLGNFFSHYTIKDMVNAIHAFLSECFNVKHLKGIIGTSMGGFQALEWAVSYPEFMDFVIPITTSHDVRGKNFAIFNLMNTFIKNDPDYKDGEYEQNPEIGPQNATMLLYLYGFSDRFYKKSSDEEVLESLEEMKKEGMKTDANDIVWRNEAAMSHDISKRVENIKSKVLIIGINEDQYFPPDLDTIPLSKMIRGSELLLYDSELGHLGTSEIKKVENVISKFLEGI